jgi:hypothetical protein
LGRRRLRASATHGSASEATFLGSACMTFGTRMACTCWRRERASGSPLSVSVTRPSPSRSTCTGMYCPVSKPTLRQPAQPS